MDDARDEGRTLTRDKVTEEQLVIAIKSFHLRVVIPVSHSITISWDPNPSPVSGYNVYRGNSTDNESNVPLNGATLITGTTFTDDTVFPGHTYFYEVTAVLDGVESEDSLELRSVPVPFDPVPASIVIGTAAGFGVLAGSTVTNTGPTSIVGDVGTSPGVSITGFGSPATITGSFHSADFVSAGAQSALTQAYNQAVAALNPDGKAAITVTGDIGGQRLTPGVYKSASTIGVTGKLTLDGQGNPGAVWIFQVGSALTVAGDVILVNGAQAANVYWQVGSSATIGAGSNFAGTIMAQASITCVTGASINGRLLARTGAVTLDTNNVYLSVMATLLMDWLPNTTFSVGEVIFDCASHSIQWVTTTGVSGATRPVFNVGDGVTTRDGTVIWTDPPFPVSVVTPLPPSPPNVPPSPPSAPINPRIDSEA